MGVSAISYRIDGRVSGQNKVGNPCSKSPYVLSVLKSPGLDNPVEERRTRDGEVAGSSLTHCAV